MQKLKDKLQGFRLRSNISPGCLTPSSCRLVWFLFDLRISLKSEADSAFGSDLDE